MADTPLQIDQEYEVVDITGDNDVLREHPRNPNKGDEEIIDESIGENGWYGAVVAQKSTGYILVGNHRYRVAKKRGATHIPVIWKDVDDDTAVKIMLVDNESAKKGEIDEAILEELLAGLDTLTGTGYDVISRLETKVEEDANPPEDPPADDDLDDPPVPEDKYKPEWGVMIMCTSERQQEETYRWLKEQLPKRELQVVAT